MDWQPPKKTPPPHTLSKSASYISINLLFLQNPTPHPSSSGNFNFFCGESMGIFWNCTFPRTLKKGHLSTASAFHLLKYPELSAALEHHRV